MAASDFAFELWHEQSTAVARRDMLRQFLGELLGAIGSGGHVGSGGRFRDPGVLQRIYDKLIEIVLPRTEKLAAAESAADGTKRPLKFHALRFARPQ